MNLGIKNKFKAITKFVGRHKKAAILTTLAATVGVSGLIYGMKLNAALTMKTEGDEFCTIHRVSSSNKLTGCYASTYKYIVDDSGTEPLELTAYCADRIKSAPPNGTSMNLHNGVITDEQFNVLVLGYSKVYKDIDGDGVNNGRYFEGGTVKTRKQNYMITQLALWAVTEGWKEGYLGDTPISKAVLPKCDHALSGLTNEDLEKTKNGYLDLCKRARQKPFSQTPILETDYHKRTAYKQNDGTMKTGLFTISTNNFYSGSYTINLNNAPSGTKVMNGETDEDITGKSVKDLKSFYFVLPSQSSSGSFTYDLVTSGGKYMKAGYYAGNDDTKQPVARIKIRTAETHPTENGAVTYTSSPGVLRVWKVSSEDGNVRLGNASFTLKKADGTDVLTQSTDGNGQSDFGGLEPGNYKLVENTAPSGYEIMVKSTDVVVEAGKITEVTIKNKPIKNRIKIVKKDSSDTLLSGAKFQIVNSSGTVVDTLTTGSDGTATSKDLPYGNYTVKETVPPSGYEIANPSSQDITISNTTSTYVVNFVNNKKPGKLTIVKTDENGGKIQGVVFEVYKGSRKVGTITTDSNGQASIDLEEGSYTYKEVSAPSKYKVDPTSKSFTITKGQTTNKTEVNYPVKSSISVVKTDADSGSFLSGAQFTLYKENKSTVVATGTSNSKGEILFNNIPYGKYYLKETTPPSGYHGYTGYMEMNVTTDGATLNSTFPNTKEVGNIKLTKTSTNGNKLANAKFKLFKSDKRTLVTTGVTNSEGVVEFNNLPLGTYYVQEYEAPSGYVLNSQFIEARLVTHLATINLNATNKPAEGSIEITKTDVTTGEALQGAEFKLYKSDKRTVVGTATTNSNGKITLSNLPIGTYYYQETNPPSGYVLDSALHPIEITSDGQVVRATVTNTKSAGKLKITKRDINTNAVIPNAKFKIYASNGTTVVTTGVTNSSGVAEFTLNVGTYYYQEYESPSGYKLNSNKFQFTISENGQIQQATMTNTPADGTFEITKTDVTSSKPLQGASFRILKEDKSTVVTTGTTDDSGKLSKVLSLGKYYYQETSAPSGYVLDSTLKPFEITSDGQVVKANVTNVKIKGGLEITKRGSDGKALQGAEFALYKEDKSTLIASGATNSSGKLTFNDLPYGTYYYKETKAPSGYVLDNSWKTLNVQTNGSVQSVTVTNNLKYGSFELTKTDVKGKALPNTEITLTNKTTGNTVTKTTDSSGKVLFTNLTEGEYSYQETRAPEGYALDSTVYTFSIASDGQKVSKTMTNNKIANRIKIVKSDSKNGSLLAGAKIGIYKAGTVTEVATAVTDSNGVATFNALEYGDYYYKELTPPSGYKLNSTKFPFKVTKYGVTQSFEIKNDKEVSLKIKKTLSNPNYALDSESYMITVNGKFADGSTSKALSFTKAEAVNSTIKDVPNVIYGETYTITEANQDKYNCTISDNSVQLSDSKTVTITNTVKPSGKLTVTKRLGDGTVMGDDETFTINIKGKFAGSTKTQVSKTIRKSDIGKAVEVPDVIYGETYVITEENNDSYAVTIDNSSVTMNGTNQNVTITNSAKKAGALYVRKTADAKTVNNSDEFRIVVKGSFSDTQATSKTIIFRKSELNTQKEVSGVRVGETYQISEEDNANYNATISDRTVTITNVGKTVEITNTRKPSGKLKITKSLVDPTGNNSDTYTMIVKGEFSDTTETTKTVSFTQDEVNNNTVKEISGVLYGNTYSITEQTSGNRYTVSYTKSLTSDNAEDVTNNNEVKMTAKDVTVTVTNKVNTGSIEITKKDISTDELIPNAKVKIKDATGKVIFQGTTDQNGVVKFSMLPVGSYTYEEYEAPSGYVLNDTPFPFEIKSDGQIVKSTLSNSKLSGKAEITKTDITTSEPLPNATITIKKENGTIVAEKTTGEDGKVVFNNLPPGKYIYCETVAPSGYVINKVEGKFEISANGQIFKATIEDEKIKGNLELTKVNVENGNPLAGAKFEILASDRTTVVASGVTDTSGKVTINNLEYGSYYYRETEAPKGFVLDNSLKPFEIRNNGETVKATVNNSPSEGGFELTKTDVVTGKVIPNAKFKIYAEDKRTVITQGVTDENGIAKFTLQSGKYWYQEYEAPSGYLIDDELYSFEIKGNKQIVKATMTNEKIKGDFKLTKTDEKGTKLEGATFEILSEDGSKVLATKTTDTNGEILVTDLTAGTYKYRETKAPSGYVLDTGLKTFTITKNNEVVSVNVINGKSAGKLIITKKDVSSGKLLPNTKFKIYASDKETVITEGITDNKGTATFTLPMGTYYYQETEAPEGYLINDEKYKFTLTENGQEERVEMTNELVKGSIEIFKKDGENQTPLKGAKFEILDSKKSKIAEGTTGDNGKLTINNLPYGSYYYKEVKAPSGYELDQTEHEFLINADNQAVSVQVNNEKSKGSLEITKVNNETNIKLSGAVFTIYSSDKKTVVGTITTDTEGKGTIKLPMGTYYYKETKSPSGFHGDEDFHEFNLESHNQVVKKTVNNDRDMGDFELTKKDVSSGKLIPNAKFKIYASDKTTVITEGVTDDNGLAKFKLPLGTYYYQEYEAPSGYILDDTLFEFTLVERDKVVKAEMTNAREAGRFEITKTDIATSKPLENAKFRIYASDKTTIVKEGVTDSEGKVNFTLPTGTYYYQEYEAPTNYIYDTGLVKFEIKANNDIVKANITNEKAKANIKIVKVDGDNDKALQGAKFQIFKSDKTTVVTKATTDSKGEIVVNDLEVGTYYVQEYEAPRGYVLDQTLYPLNLNENGKTFELKVLNNKSAGELEIIKSDLDSGELLDGATYQILAEDGTTVVKTGTTAEGKVTFTLPYGNYFYQETKAPSGYILDETKHAFSITENGQKITETRTNEKMKGNILIKKTNEDGEVLAGVKFKILQSDKRTEVKTIVTDAKGEAKIENLPVGKYYYQETETSDKYVLDDEIKELNLTTHKQLLEINVVNKKAKGSLKVIKKSKDGNKPLANAEFTVYDSKDKAVISAKTNDQGEVVFNDLLVGEYYVKETKAPTGYILNTEKVSFNITREGEVITKTILNDKIKGDFELTKKDISNGDLVPNTSFRIYKEDKTTVVTEGKTNENGIAKFKNLEYGKYYYQEFDAPDDFVIDNGLYEFEIRENGVTVKAEMKDKLKDGKVIITKKDDEGAFLADVKFKIYSSDKKTAVKEGKTDSNGKLELVLQPGIYYYQEVETPSGYITDDSLHEFKIERAAKTTEVEVVNKFIRASVTVNKTGVEIKSPLEGAKFKITQDGKDVTIQTGNGEGESVFTTDKDGKINIPQKLKVGKYQLVELSAPSGYKVAEPIDFEVTKDDNGKDIKLEVKDQEIKGNIKLVKTDDDGNTLAGVKFKLVQTIDTRGNKINKEIGTYTTDSNGEIKIKDLLYGEYYIQEVETVEGYVLDDSKIDFTVNEDGKTIDLNKVNKHAKGNVVLTKVDSKDRKPLKGVKFELFNSNNESQGEYTTDSNGEIKVEDLVYGKYYFKEKEAIEGYVKSEDKVDFNIQEDGTTVKVEAENDRIVGDMELTKTDVVNGDLVPNANFEILAEDKETVVVKGKTDKNGIAKFKLDYGKYYYREFGAPEGYVLDGTPYPFEIKSKDEIVKCEMTNKPITGELEITKKDIIDGELIPNAKFEILNEDKEVVKKGTTDENGIAKFQLGYGKYYYHEYDAPSGYILDDKLYPFEIKTDGEIIKCIATNRKEITPENPQNKLPKTGVISAMGGVSALALGGIALGLRRKSRK